MSDFGSVSISIGIGIDRDTETQKVVNRRGGYSKTR